MKKIYFLLFTLMTASFGFAQISINEIDPDQSGTDSAEFVEILTTPNTALDGYVVVMFNGSDDQSYAAYDLDGFTTDADGFFMLANTTHPNYSAATDMALPSNGLQNGADAIALYLGNDTDFPNDTPITLTNLQDVLVYGTNDSDDTGLLTGFGETVQYNDTATESIQRKVDGTYETKPSTFRADNSSGLPACDLVLGARNATCDAFTSGTDTYTVTIEFTGGGTSAYVVGASSGTIGGDDPAAVATGTITITGVSEGTNVSYTASNLGTGGSCDLNATLSSPTCVGATCAPVGSVIVTEIFNNATGSDTDKEWLEIYNTTGSTIDMTGWTLRDDGSDSHIISGLMIPGNSYMVLGQSSDMALNGGVSVDYVYSGMFLGNGTDEVVLECTGTIIDSVIYDNGATFPDVEGVSMELSTGHLNATDNDSGAAWCPAVTDMGAGDLGTPGAANDCAAVLSIQTNEIEGFSMYPNPVVDGMISINTLNATTKNVTLFDVLGKKVFNTSYNGTSNRINIGDLNAGIYILNVTEGNKSAISKLIIN